MNIKIPKEYLIWGGVAVALGVAYWWLKSSGTWDRLFSPPVPPAVPAPAPVIPQQQPQQSDGFELSAYSGLGGKVVN